MSYWIIQAIAACLLFAVQFTPARHYKFSLYPEWAVFTLFIINAAIFICLTHFVIRAAVKYQQHAAIAGKKLFATVVICILLSCLIDVALTVNLQAWLTPALDETTKALRLGTEYKYYLNELGADTPRWRFTQILASLLGVTFLYGSWSTFYFFLTSMRSRIQIKEKVKSGQLALLMSQLNPHFLFNSMNSIRGMIFEDKQLAKELVDKLTELFRYNLSSNQKITESLEDELRVCEFYLDIEQTRLEERLLIEIFIEPDTLTLQVPTMGLLTLLENAIKHGIAPRVEQSLLTIKTYQTDTYWHLAVTNPLYHGSYKAPGTGTGLTNLKQRLNLMYGENASIDINKTPDSFSAILTLPLKG
ncbi:sensor histidine kinase [Pseudoalteromonas denitrificans]|uniref:Histidine kinase n=1 Tax=Pseudoalteromonas denitrificans DSM 6059 TaxID=1123010 RepID=A0A1I1LWU7_9GAMM|nr:histidine kinase [Pseudoalteromonas denitrificans]SFC75418.1 Histidine kinase [Pseudoalteromonas denitrificans DSM 6059]